LPGTRFSVASNAALNALASGHTPAPSATRRSVAVDLPITCWHATDIDVQVDLEITAGAVNTKRLEAALQNAEFDPDNERIWRWKADGPTAGAIVKFELLADVDTERAGSTIEFDQCEQLGAANRRGTGIAVHDIEQRPLRARVGDQWIDVEINVTGLAGFLLAKTAAAHSRRKPKDSYDIAFVLVENSSGGVDAAVDAVSALTRGDLRVHSTALDDLRSNFADPGAQGPAAYTDQMLQDHPELTATILRADAVLAGTVPAALALRRRGRPIA
jgi:hypothetical protein